MSAVHRELAALKFIDSLTAHLKNVREPHKAMRHALRETREFFRCADRNQTEGTDGALERWGARTALYRRGLGRLADDDGRAEQPFLDLIDRAPGGGAPLLDAVLARVKLALAGQPQPDDLTLLTTRVMAC
jgi:hypothetical protein